MSENKKITEFLVKSSASDNDENRKTNVENDESPTIDDQSSNSDVRADAPRSQSVEPHAPDGMSPCLDPTGKKRIASRSPSADTDVMLKRQSLGIMDESFCSEILAEEKSFDKEPHWVPLIFQSLGAVREDIRGLSEELKSEMAVLRSEMSSMKSEMATLKTENTELKSECESYKSEMAALKVDTAELKKTVGLLLAQVDSNEQHSRSECLLLHGVPEKTNPTVPENSKLLFASEISSKCGVTINERNIKRAHRYGPPRRDGKPRPIIARFHDAGIRNSVYSKKKNLKGKGIFVTENLTKRRMDMFIKAKDEYGNQSVWTKEGRIYARDTEGNVITIIS